MAEEIDKIVAYLRGLPSYSSMTVEECRAAYDKAELAYPLPPDVKSEPLAGQPGERLRPPGARSDAAILYLHGGGYAIGSTRSATGYTFTWSRWDASSSVVIRSTSLSTM